MTRFLVPAPKHPIAPGRRPTFSVVIAAYNAAGVIGEAIESVLTQTFHPCEIVICDDGSTDDLEAALKPYDSQIQFLRKEHGGEASAKNAAAAAASGEFVVILDADDVFLPSRLEALAELACARPDLDILTTDAYLTVDGRNVRRCYEGGWTFAVDDQRLEILRRNFVFGLTAVRRKLLLTDGGFDESILWTTDWDRWLRLILGGSQVGAVDEPLALYRLSPSSLSAQRSDLVRGKLATLEKARRNQALSADERSVLEGSLAGYRRELVLGDLRQALAENRPGTPRRALNMAMAPRLALRQRAEMATGALAPSLAGRRLRMRAERFWTGAGGIQVARRDVSPTAGQSSRQGLVGTRRPRRVMIYTDAKQIGGAERSLKNLLAELSPRIEVTVVGVDHRIVQAIAVSRTHANTIVLPFVESRYDVRATFAHLRALITLRPDVFHANLNSPWCSQIAIVLALSLPGTRVVAVEQLPTPPATAQKLRLKRLTASRLSAHVAVGDSSAREIESILRLRPGSVRTIHNGVPDIELADSASRPDLSPTTGALTIGSVGRLEVQKGFDILLRALPGLPEVTALIVGDGSERARLQQLAEALGVAHRVHLPGWSNEPRTWLRSFDVFVLPSRAEGFPLAVVEAMLAELPVVASNVGSVREAVLHQETGLLVSPEDPDALAGALRKLLDDAPRRRSMAARGRALALDRYTAAAMARGFESLYDEICR